MTAIMHVHSTGGGWCACKIDLLNTEIMFNGAVVLERDFDWLPTRDV